MRFSWLPQQWSPGRPGTVWTSRTLVWQTAAVNAVTAFPRVSPQQWHHESDESFSSSLTPVMWGRGLRCLPRLWVAESTPFTASCMHAECYPTLTLWWTGTVPACSAPTPAPPLLSFYSDIHLIFPTVVFELTISNFGAQSLLSAILLFNFRSV